VRVPKATNVVTINAADMTIDRAAVGDNVASVQLDGKSQTATLKFTGVEDSSLQTSFVIDDTALNVS